MISKQKKTEIIAELVEKFEKTSGFYLIDFKGMTVDDAIRVRRAMRKLEVDYKVAKNTLILRAIKEVGGIEIPEELFKGETAIIFGYEDPVSPAKILKEEFKKNEKTGIQRRFN